jgi:predicted nucleic acid-binding protein
VFLDANTLIYHFTFHARYGAAATGLVKRIERQELTGFTSTHLLSEVAHRMMTIEASARFGWPFAGIANRLRRHPSEVRQLTGHGQAIDSIPNLRIQVLTIPPGLISTACAMSQPRGCFPTTPSW